MEPIYLLDGQEIYVLAELFAHAAATRATVRVALDDGLKVKVSHETWTPPMGTKED